MSNLSQAIQEKSEKLGRSRFELEQLEDKQKDLLEKSIEIDAESADDDELAVLDELKTINDDIEKRKTVIGKMEQQIEALKSNEQQKAEKGAKPAEGGSPAVHKRVKRKTKPGDQLVRMAVIKAMSHIKRVPEQTVLEEIYQDDFETKLIHNLTTKTAAPIGTTTDADYAAELVDVEVRGLLEAAEGTSVGAALLLWAQRSGGVALSFGSANSVRIPNLAPTGAAPTEPAWVQEGGAIPVGSLTISSAVLMRYKLAEILATTMELKERSIVSIEDLFRRAMTKAYTRQLDLALLSANAAVPNVRPAGLLSGITVKAGDATGGMDSVIADVQGMEGEILAANEDAVPVLLMNNRNRRSLSFITGALGTFVFRDEISSGRIFETPVVASSNVPYNTSIMVDASSLAMALDAPEFDVSQVATIVQANADGTAPTMADDGSGAVGTAGEVQEGIGVVPSAAVGAGAGAGYTARSLWQTYSEGVRMIAPTSFGLLRAGTVAGRNTLKWG